MFQFFGFRLPRHNSAGRASTPTRVLAGQLISTAGLVGRPVLNQSGSEIGRVRDVVVRWDESLYPAVTGLVVKVGRRASFLHASSIASVDRGHQPDLPHVHPCSGQSTQPARRRGKPSLVPGRRRCLRRSRGELGNGRRRDHRQRLALRSAPTSARSDRDRGDRWRRPSRSTVRPPSSTGHRRSRLRRS